MMQELTEQQKIYRVCERVYIFGLPKYRDMARRASVCRLTANRLFEIVKKNPDILPNFEKERARYK